MKHKYAYKAAAASLAASALLFAAIPSFGKTIPSSPSLNRGSVRHNEISNAGEKNDNEKKGDKEFRSQNLSNTSTSVTSVSKVARNQAAALQRTKDRATRQIDERITALNKLSTRISSMKKVSDGSKTILNATIQAQIAELNALKTKIASDTDAQSLKTDVQSITKAYRIYALVMPEVNVLASADRVGTLADMMTALASKLQDRISQAQTTGKDVSSLQTALADMNAKIADANAQAQAAISGVSGLTPDQGDQTKLHANLQALKDARNKIKAANKDLKAAQKDANKITRSMRAMGMKVTSTPSPTPSASATPSPSPTSSPSATPTPTPSPSPSETPTPTLSPSPTPSI
jgi:DNA repair exonuclease SbcCD ATPase subunit